MSRTEFKPTSDNPNFNQQQEQVLQYWNKIDAFKRQLELTQDCKPYYFYDGPPFATGTPHYGHILAGTIKDVICRYQTQNGRYVERRFGWDCHGLPIEFEIDKLLKVNSKKQILQMGIDQYNNECRKIVMRFANEWRYTIGRFGRWIDFDNDYQTMDLKFMESVWAVFKEIYKKGHVYRGCRVMPYSTACNTVLSNFETQQNYKDVSDPSVYITFPLLKEPDVSLLVWTTTPWTLPSNLAVAVNPEFTYVQFKDLKLNRVFIVAESRLKDIYENQFQVKEKDFAKAFQIIEQIPGKALEGLEYEPLYQFYEDRRSDGCFRVLLGTYVTADTGTGLVHQAPAFGQEDYHLAIKYKIIQPDNPPSPIDDNGNFTSRVDYIFKAADKEKRVNAEGKQEEVIVDRNLAGTWFKNADKYIRKDLKDRGRMVIDSQLKHSYPHCWRSETPLMYRAIHSWFIKVTDVKDKLVANNKKSKWVPLFAQEGRFNNWLESAQDWCFSRNRFWGNPIPIWVSQDYEEQICIGSIQELKELSGVKDITDLHRESIDNITIPSKKGKGVLRRVDEVFDCWFESGAMPFGQVHWPFTTSDEEFMKRFPADFIGEGLDQTRGWFYTLNVIATMVKDDTPYKNLIVNGIVLAEDGKKMSKRLKNYPDPLDVVSRHGADAIRLYLINGPLVRAEQMSFVEKDVAATVREVFLPWYNAYRFLLQNINRWEKESGQAFVFDEKLAQNKEALKNPMDRWIQAKTQNLIKKVREEMDNYRLYTVVDPLLKFLDNLTNWYVRLNRSRLKGEISEEDCIISLNVLLDVLLKNALLLSPFIPFVTEMIYQNLVKVIPTGSPYHADSIHFLRIPEFRDDLIDEKFELNVKRMQQFIDESRAERTKQKISLKKPISSITIIHKDPKFFEDFKPLLHYIAEEINCDQVNFDNNREKYIEIKVEPNHAVLGGALKQIGIKYDAQKFNEACKKLTPKQIEEFSRNSTFKFCDTDFKKEWLVFKEIKISNFASEFSLCQGDDPDVLFMLDTKQTEPLLIKWASREFTNRIQRLRKTSKLTIEDDIVIFFDVPEASKYANNALNTLRKDILGTVKKPTLPLKAKQDHLIVIATENCEFDDNDQIKQTFSITLCWNGIKLNQEKLVADFGEEGAQNHSLVITSFPLQEVKETVKNNGGKYPINETVSLIEQQHFNFEWESY